jgi:hypothetical protein
LKGRREEGKRGDGLFSYFVGVRPYIPIETPYELVNIIGECWENNYFERPSFDATTVVLRDYMKVLTGKSTSGTKGRRGGQRGEARKRRNKFWILIDIILDLPTKKGSSSSITTDEFFSKKGSSSSITDEFFSKKGSSSSLTGEGKKGSSSSLTHDRPKKGSSSSIDRPSKKGSSSSIDRPSKKGSSSDVKVNV